MFNQVIFRIPSIIDDGKVDLRNREPDEIFRQINEGKQSKFLSGGLGKKRMTPKYQKEKLHLKILIKIITAKFLQESFLNFTKDQN